MVIINKPLRNVPHTSCFFTKLGQFGNHFKWIAVILGLLQLLFDLPDGSVLTSRALGVAAFVPRSDQVAIDKDDSVGDLVSFGDGLDYEANRLNVAVDLHRDAVARHLPTRFLGAVKRRA